MDGRLLHLYIPVFTARGDENYKVSVFIYIFIIIIIYLLTVPCITIRFIMKQFAWIFIMLPILGEHIVTALSVLRSGTVLIYNPLMDCLGFHMCLYHYPYLILCHTHADPIPKVKVKLLLKFALTFLY